jgi:DNA invertase Pin-like site-specific DNA recombinase
MATVVTERCKLVAYYRVSTDEQGEIGLGMKAQQRLVAAYSESSGCEIVKNYTEVESGKLSALGRPELAKALAYCKRTKGTTLVIAKLDRLARNLNFISGLMESKVPFIAADSPNDDRFILHIKAAVYEEEGRRISLRTKEALAELKANGVTLGTPANLTPSAQAKGARANRDKAMMATAVIAPRLRDLRRQGKTLAAIADELNTYGCTTPRGAAWTPTSVKRVLDRS